MLLCLTIFPIFVIWWSAGLWAFVRIKISALSTHEISATTLGGKRIDFQWRSPRQVLVLTLIRIVGHLLRYSNEITFI
jgi:hypothetical protein